MAVDDYLTYEEVLERLKARAQALGSQVLLAKEAGVSYQLLNDVIHRRSKRLGPKLLAGLGLREVVLYAPIAATATSTATTSTPSPTPSSTPPPSATPTSSQESETSG